MSAKRKAKLPKANRVRFSVTIDASTHDALLDLAVLRGEPTNPGEPLKPVPLSHLIEDGAKMLLRKARRDGPIPKRPPDAKLRTGRGDRKGRK